MVLGALKLLTTTVFMATSLRQHLLNGGRSYGPFLLSDSPVVAEMLAMIGYGHIVVDHEHSPTSIRSGQAMLQAIDAAKAYSSTKTEAIVRTPSHDPVYMKKVLDSLRLPAGVLVPMVENAEMAKQVVQSTRYPLGDQSNGSLDGIRGCAAPLIRGSGWGMTPHNYVQQTRQDLLVMVQVETPQAIDEIPEIAEVEGVDGIFIGPLDMSASVGKMGQFQDKNVQTLIASAEEAIRSSPAFLAGFRAPGRDLKDMHDAGYQLICGSVDLALLRQAAQDDVASVEEFLQ